MFYLIRVKYVIILHAKAGGVMSFQHLNRRKFLKSVFMSIPLFTLFIGCKSNAINMPINSPDLSSSTKIKDQIIDMPNYRVDDAILMNDEHVYKIPKIMLIMSKSGVRGDVIVIDFTTGDMALFSKPVQIMDRDDDFFFVTGLIKDDLLMNNPSKTLKVLKDKDKETLTNYFLTGKNVKKRY